MKHKLKLSAMALALLAVSSFSMQDAQAQIEGPQLKIKVRAELLNGIGPKVGVFVDGRLLQNYEVNHTEFREVILTSTAFQPGAKVDVFFSNDGYEGPGKDRNLFVESITVTGSQAAGVYKSAQVGTYDKGYNYAQATDGKDTLTGKEKMGENGAMRFVLKSNVVEPPKPVDPPNPVEPPKPAPTGSIKSNDSRALMVFDADKSIREQPNYMQAYTSHIKSQSITDIQINKIPETGYQVDGNPKHKSFERLFSPKLAKNVFSFTMAKSYPTINNGDNVRFTPGGSYSSKVGPNKEFWCALSFMPTTPGDYGGIHGVHHLNTEINKKTPYTLLYRNGSFGLITRSTTSVNNGNWDAGAVNGRVPFERTPIYFPAAINEHHKVIVNFRIGYLKEQRPFIKIWHKAGQNWQKGGNPVVDIANLPIGHFLSNQNHELRPAGIYNVDASERYGKTWPTSATHVPSYGDFGMRSLSRGGICLEALPPKAGEPQITKEALMGWLER